MVADDKNRIRVTYPFIRRQSIPATTVINTVTFVTQTNGFGFSIQAFKSMYNVMSDVLVFSGSTTRIS